ncbi:MAG: hypothetical protein JXQ73_19080 [Phycisphaerae bacterium]|nr:hypothetical protein [Phycisphaerae bacterium]
MNVIALMIGALAASAQPRTLTQQDLDRGATPAPGDQIILRDWSRLSPKDALSDRSTPGKWWRRRYNEKDKPGDGGTILMTVERNMDRPDTCIVPAVTYPLALRGWYSVWVATYRGAYGGGVDVRLTGDDCFVHMDPQQVAYHSERPKPRVGAIVEINYRPAADLTGQGLVFQQPFGTYESFWWGFSEASLAYIRLVRLSDDEVAAFKQDQARNDPRLIAYDDDNFSRFWMWGGKDRTDVLRTIEMFRYHDIAFFGLCLGATTALHVPTPHTDLSVPAGRRLGDERARRTFRAFQEKGIDRLALMTERAHKYGFKLMPTLRMSAIYNSGPNYKALSKWRLKNNVHLDYAQPRIRDYFVSVVRHILETYDVDGFILDFTRHCVYFNPDEPDKVGKMGLFCDAMRKMVDEVSAKKGRKLLLAATFSEKDYVSGFHAHHLKSTVKPEERLAVQGIDVALWAKKGYFDIIMPEGPHWAKYIEMTRGTKTKCYPRWTYTCDYNGKALGGNIHDPTPKEDKKDRPINPHCGPLDYESGWLKLRDKGADGLYVFNNAQGWATLRRMGHLDEVRQRVQAKAVYGLSEGPIVQFVD